MIPALMAPARRFACILALFLGACGADVGAANHGLGFGYDFAAPDGLRFRNLPGVLELDEAAFLAQIDAAYQGTEDCAGIHVPGPLVVVQPMQDFPVVGNGLTYLDTGTVVVSPLAIEDLANFGGDPATGRLPGTSVLHHEFIHYLLRQAGFPDGQNAAHASALFLDCSGLGLA